MGLLLASLQIYKVKNITTQENKLTDNITSQNKLHDPLIEEIKIIKYSIKKANQNDLILKFY